MTVPHFVRDLMLAAIAHFHPYTSSKCDLSRGFSYNLHLIVNTHCIGHVYKHASLPFWLWSRAKHFKWDCRLLSEAAAHWIIHRENLSTTRPTNPTPRPPSKSVKMVCISFHYSERGISWNTRAWIWRGPLGVLQEYFEGEFATLKHRNRTNTWTTMAPKLA